MDLHDIKVALVVILCVPMAYAGIRFFASLMDSALAGNAKSGKKQGGRGGAAR